MLNLCYITSMKTKDARSLPAVAQEDLRRKVIKSIWDGKKQVEAAKLFGVTRQAIGKWLKAYRKGGSKAIKPSDREDLVVAAFFPGNRLK